MWSMTSSSYAFPIALRACAAALLLASPAAAIDARAPMVDVWLPVAWSSPRRRRLDETTTELVRLLPYILVGIALILVTIVVVGITVVLLIVLVRSETIHLENEASEMRSAKHLEWSTEPLANVHTDDVQGGATASVEQPASASYIMGDNPMHKQNLSKHQMARGASAVGGVRNPARGPERVYASTRRRVA